MATPPDAEVAELARSIAELGAGERTRVFRMSWWSERMLDWAMAKPAFKTQLFRFVDVFPATTDDADVLRHIEEYFDGADVPKALDLGIDVAEHVPFGRSISARAARRNIARMAEQFIVGTNAAEAVEGLHRLWRQGSAATVDLLGEKTIVEAEADRYARRVEEMLRVLLDASARWAPDDHLERDDAGPIPRVNVSIKPTALASHYSPLTREEGLREAKERLRPLMRVARDRGAFVNFDMEHYDVKDLTLQLFRDLLSEEEFASLEAGIVIQAYLRDARTDLADLVAWSSQRQRPITVRLVKGAYWDTETVVAQAAGWPVPVFQDKDETDASYERCVQLLHDHHGDVRAAFASHNLRSLAYAISYARANGIPDSGFEIQMLYGMAEPIQAAIRRLGLRLRVYAPVGELVPGMAYLVRRLLENTSNESFVRHRFAEGRDLDELLSPPGVETLPNPAPPVRRPATDAGDPGPYDPEPPAEWRRAEVRASFGVAVDHAGAMVGVEVPAVIGRERAMVGTALESRNPSQPDVVVARSASCGAAEADMAVAAALEAWEGWRRTPVKERAAVLFRAAEWMRSRRDELAALEVHEGGKPWKEADADVCEAVDFCEYYGREMLRLDQGGRAVGGSDSRAVGGSDSRAVGGSDSRAVGGSDSRVQSPPGEANSLRYGPKGIGVVIAPWNFPLAIPTGMVTAALVAGNAVVLKPAEQTPAVALRLVEALEAGGLPPGVLGFLPGIGEDVGAALVEHPDVSFIVFTGSKAVGLAINHAAAAPREGQRHIKRVIAELGGKNALIVDGDADPDQAVPAIVHSAFGYAGQKCSAASRLIVLDAVYDAVVDRLVGATRELIVGDPRQMATEMGPVIDAEAYKKVRGHVDAAPDQGNVLLARDDVPDRGWFVGPTIVDSVSGDAPIARDEIFGPVLTVFRAADFDDALRIANDTEYALTAGLYSRSPVHIRRAAEELRAGNIYVNRGTTGAVVGRQPFGGFGMSGVGSKAGGPDYLLQMLDPRVVTENTLRQGFAPPDA